MKPIWNRITYSWITFQVFNEHQCCDRKSRAACAQSFAPWQQATIEITRRDHSFIACSRHIHNGVILHAHPVRGESHNQCNTTGEVATPASSNIWNFLYRNHKASCSRDRKP